MNRGPRVSIIPPKGTAAWYQYWMNKLAEDAASKISGTVRGDAALQVDVRMVASVETRKAMANLLMEMGVFRKLEQVTLRKPDEEGDKV